MIRLSKPDLFVYVNSAEKLKGDSLTMKFVGYVNPYLVVTNGGRYTKHIYAGTQRIASKLGDIDAFGADPRRVATAGHDVENIEPIDYGKKYSAQNNAFKARFDSLDSKFNGKSLDDYINGKSFCCGDNSLDEIEKNKENTAENAKIEDNLYFYHPDHLGSTNLITNFDGEVTQSVAYIPYGEVFVEERNGSWATPFLFNAKELDEETGLYYYGARYLDPMDARWLSPDPMQGKYPGMSPYNYCAGNPVKLVDPDGRDYNVTIDEENRTITISATYYTTKKDESSSQKAVDFWNSQSGKFTCEKINKNDKNDKKEYSINFDLRVEIADHRSDAMLKASENESGNSITIVEELDKNKNGITLNGKYIRIKESQKDKDTGAHEVGHTLGLVHNVVGLMTPSETEQNRTSEILMSDIKTMIEYPLSGKVRKENGNPSGKGVINYVGTTSFDSSKFKLKINKNE